MVDEFYLSPRWRRVRAAALARDGYQCQLSRRFGKHRQAEMVHHIFPKDEYPQYALSLWNLISLTKAQHDTLHDRTNGQLSAAGIDLLRRTARKNGVEIPPQYK